MNLQLNSGIRVARFATRFICASAIVFAGLQVAHAGFTDFVIRNSSGNVAPVINYPAAGQTEFVILLGGQKAGLGSNDINGHTLGEIAELKIDRIDDRTRFSAGSGPFVAPYFNIWITDGLGNFAVVANEPSNPDFQPLYNHGFDLDFADLANKPAMIHETTNKSWLPNAGVGLKFSDLSGFLIEAPTVAQLNAGWGGLGTGAPRQLGTNVAYGVNWIFGDTLSNYISGDPAHSGFVVSDASVTATPEPGTLALMFGAMGVAGVMRVRRVRRGSR